MSGRSWLLAAAVLGPVLVLAVLAAALTWTRARPRGGEGPELRLHLATVVDVTPGENRLAFGFTDREGRVLTGADLLDVRVAVLDPSGREPRALETVPARYVRSGWPDVSQATYFDQAHVLAEGFFTAIVTFPRAGSWTLEFVARRPGQGVFVQRLLPNVLSEALTPALGAAAPRTRTPTLVDVRGDLSRLDSDPRLNDRDLHRVSIAEALRARRPAAVLFASPGLDELRLSLPVTELLSSLHSAYGARVAFIHVEVYDLARYRRRLLDGAGDATSALEFGEVAQQWGVQNAPWLFLIDREGRIAAKFFGPIARDEVEAAVRRLVSEGPGARS